MADASKPPHLSQRERSREARVRENARPPSAPPIRHSRESGNPGWPIGHAPLTLREGTRERSDARGRRSARPPISLPSVISIAPNPSLPRPQPVIPAKAGIQDAPFPSFPRRREPRSGAAAARSIPLSLVCSGPLHRLRGRAREGAAPPANQRPLRHSRAPRSSFPRTRESRHRPHPLDTADNPMSY